MASAAAGAIHLPTRQPRTLRDWYGGRKSSSTIAAIASVEDFHTPNFQTSSRPIATQIAAFTARRAARGSPRQRSRSRPRAPSIRHHSSAIDRPRRRTSGPLGRPFAEQALGTEDEDQDQD